jgi:hypothetical protein
MVDHDQNRIEAPRDWEISDKIHREVCEWGNSGGINGDKWRDSRVSISLHLLTQGATFNVSMDIGTHSRPPVIAFNEFFSFKMTGMSG